MAGPEFWQTGRGVKFFDADVPRLIKALERIVASLEVEMPERVHCSRCGKPVSTPVPKKTIVRAWVECPECIEKEVAKDGL